MSAATPPPRPRAHVLPTGTECVEAVRELLLERVMPALDPALAYEVRVAAHLLGIVARESEVAGDDDAWATEALGGLGVTDEERLAHDLRAGTWPGDHETLRAVLTELTRRRLAVVNPGLLEPAGDDDPRRS